MNRDSHHELDRDDPPDCDDVFAAALPAFAEVVVSSSSRPLREQTRETVRAAILSAAHELFGKHGYQATKMAAIAKNAGVAAGTLYNYFPSKEAVFDEIVRSGGQICFDAIEAKLEAAKCPLDALSVLVFELLQMIEEQREMYVIVEEIQINPESSLEPTTPGSAADALRKRFFRLADKVIAQVQAQGDFQGYAQEDLLNALLGLCHGFLRSWVGSGQTYSLTDKAPILTSIFLNGVRHSDPR